MSARARAELLAAVDAGLLGVSDVVRSVPVDEVAAGLHVEELLRCAGVRDFRAVMRRARHVHGGAFNPTLRWVYRGGPGRVAAYAEALGREASTWPGFPFTAAPSGWRR